VFHAHAARVANSLLLRLRRIPTFVKPAAQVTATYIAQTSLFKTLYVFPAEKNIMARERSKDSYDVRRLGIWGRPPRCVSY
jgi:hypothetical protein